MITPYKAGLIFYILLILATITLLGCKTIQRLQMKKEAEQILQTPDLTTPQHQTTIHANETKRYRNTRWCSHGNFRIRLHILRCLSIGINNGNRQSYRIILFQPSNYNLWNTTMKTTLSFTLLLLLAAFALAFLPFLFIWALNGLFSLSIAYTWMNWFYAVVLFFLLRFSITSK